MIDNNGVFNIAEKQEIEKLVLENQVLTTKVYTGITAKELLEAIKNVDIKSITAIANTFDEDIKNVILFGIGGSSLGVRAFVASKIPSSKLKRSCYFMENIDPVSIVATLKSVDPKKSLFIFVSKSGNTIETLSQAEYTIDWLKQQKIQVDKHCISITSTVKDNDLSRLSKDNNIKIYSWLGDVGGRFSVFTISTLLPLALIGFDLEKIAKACKELDPQNGLTGAVINYLLWQKGYDVNVVMPYSDQLTSFAAWYRQLWAESIGKDGFGSVPEFSVGTIDQHSMLQMYLGGKKNKFFTLIKIDSSGTRFANEESQEVCVDLKYSSLLPQKGIINFSQMLRSACDATVQSMIEEGCPVRVITIPVVDEYFMAKMMIDFIFETIFTVELANKYLGYSISAFGQPNVEKSKKNLINSIKIQ